MHSVTKATTTINNFRSVKSADRLLDVLEFLAPQRRPATHAELSRSLQIPKSSLTLLLNNLIGRGYVTVAEAERGYFIGDGVHAIVSATQHAERLKAIVRPVLNALAKKTAETCALNVWKSAKIHVIDSIDSPQPLTYRMNVGDSAPAYAVSSGKAILANLPKDELTRYLRDIRFQRFTQRTIDSRKTLKKDLEQVRRQGVAYSREGFIVGIMGIAVALLDPSGYPVGAVNFAIPSARMTDELQESCIRMLLDCCNNLRSELTASRDYWRTRVWGQA